MNRSTNASRRGARRRTAAHRRRRGTGKTRTLVHRVAHLIERGVDPRRILLLTFTRRAAGEMLRRVDYLLAQLGRAADAGAAVGRSDARSLWGGTFHSIAARLL